MKKNKIEQFYDAGGGENLTNENYLTSEIRDYLTNEREILTNLIKKNNYEGILEIGCMDGRNLEIAKNLKINYVGIDIVERFIEKANEKMKNLNITAEAFKCDVKSLKRVKNLISNKFLAVFPFNSFGNIDGAEEALRSVSKQQLDCIILTYKTSIEANTARKAYLNRSQKTALKMTISSKGVLFTSAKGLHSYAYSSKKIKEMGENNGYKKIDEHDFSKIGKLYYLKK
jgi:ubiquinone/menaquinone biosynthesis C-methylase UbiE